MVLLMRHTMMDMRRSSRHVRLCANWNSKWRALGIEEKAPSICVSKQRAALLTEGTEPRSAQQCNGAAE